MGMGFAPTWLRQVSPPASHDHFNHRLLPDIRCISDEQDVNRRSRLQTGFEIRLSCCVVKRRTSYFQTSGQPINRLFCVGHSARPSITNTR